MQNIDKEQINRATAINTEITLNGEKVEAEELGFNTNLEKAQEKTKDEEKHLNTKLHTDLANESEKNKLKYAGKKIGAFSTEANDTNKFKESLFGIAVDKYKDENQKQFNLIKDENLTEQQILKTATDIVEKFFESIDYKGKIPEINLTNQKKLFSVDSLDKETGERRTEKVYFSIAQIRDKNLDFSQLMSHELAHMNTYNEGFLGEETALHTRKQVGSENKNKKMSEKEKAEYLAKIENRYESKDINKMYEEANQIAESAKEYYMSPEDLAYRKKYQNSEREYHLPTGERFNLLKDGFMELGKGATTATIGTILSPSGLGVPAIGTGVSTGMEGLGKMGSSVFATDKDLGIAVNPIRDTIFLGNQNNYEAVENLIIMGTTMAAQSKYNNFLEKTAESPKKQLESLGIKAEERNIGLQVDGTTTRGLEIDEAIGNNLGRTFKVFDKFIDGVATSVKSVHLDAKSYQAGNALYYKLNKDLKVINNFNEYRSGTMILNSKNIDTRVLQIVINNQTLNNTQIENLKKISENANKMNIKVEAIILK